MITLLMSCASLSIACAMTYLHYRDAKEAFNEIINYDRYESILNLQKLILIN